MKFSTNSCNRSLEDSSSPLRHLEEAAGVCSRWLWRGADGGKGRRPSPSQRPPNLGHALQGQARTEVNGRSRKSLTSSVICSQSGPVASHTLFFFFNVFALFYTLFFFSKGCFFFYQSGEQQNKGSSVQTVRPPSTSLAPLRGLEKKKERPG